MNFAMALSSVASVRVDGVLVNVEIDENGTYIGDNFSFHSGPGYALIQSDLSVDVDADLQITSNNGTVVSTLTEVYSQPTEAIDSGSSPGINGWQVLGGLFAISALIRSNSRSKE